MEEDGGGECVSVQTQLFELEVIVWDIVLTQRLVHVQDGTVIFPGVAAGMRVVSQVALQDLVQSLL